MSKYYKLAVISAFLAFICLFFVLNILLPDVEFSPRENRYLQQLPPFSLRALADGSYTADFESYTTDQFAFRDTWTSIKARCERFCGKQENKGIYYGENGHLLERFTAPETKYLEENVDFVHAMAEQAQVPVSLALIPGAVEIQKELLPNHAPSDSQKAVIDLVYDRFEGLYGGQTIDIYSSLVEHKDEYIFYRTDHHWTSLGAYYGFEAIADAWGLPCPPLSEYERETVSESFYGTTYSSSGFSWVAPDSMEIFVPEEAGTKITSFAGAEPEEVPMYDRSRLSQKDKYSMFFGGNTPRLDIDTGRDGEHLLILRDSYCDSLTPFLLDSFSRISVLDMRYFKGSVAQFVNESGVDRILVIYSVENFCEDENIFMMSF